MFNQGKVHRRVAKKLIGWPVLLILLRCLHVSNEKIKSTDRVSFAGCDSQQRVFLAASSSRAAATCSKLPSYRKCGGRHPVKNPRDNTRVFLVGWTCNWISGVRGPRAKQFWAAVQDGNPAGTPKQCAKPIFYIYSSSCHRLQFDSQSASGGERLRHPDILLGGWEKGVCDSTL